MVQKQKRVSKNGYLSWLGWETKSFVAGRSFLRLYSCW